MQGVEYLVKMNGEVPICGSCGHRHVLGVKCSICGHVGKSQIFTKMKMRANEKRSFRIVICSGANVMAEESTFEVIEVCRRLACSECNRTDEHEFNMPEEASSMHGLAYVGDLPVAVVRFSIQESVDAVLLRIDRFTVLKDYQQNGIGYRMLHSILQSLQSSKPVMIVAVVSPLDWLHSKLASFGFIKASVEANSSTSEWQCTFGADPNHGFKALMNFLSTKASTPL